MGSETAVGTVRGHAGGATVGSNGLFYGGSTSSFAVINAVTRIDSNGSLVGSETAIGTARYAVAGASL